MVENKRGFLEKFTVNKSFRILALSALLSSTSAHFLEEVPVPTNNPIWIIGEADLVEFAEKSPPLANRLFNSPSTFVIDTEHATLPEDWNTNIALPFASYAEFAEIAEQGIDPRITAVVYDNEGWDRTPLEEQQNIEKYTEKFAELAHDNNLIFISSPHVSLSSANARVDEGLNANWDFYMQVVRSSARYADVLVLQLQWSVYDREKYNDLLVKAANVAREEARKYNKKIAILGEVSTNQDIPEATAKNLLPIVTESLSEVRGMWLLLNHEDRGVGLDLLALLRSIYPPRPRV